MIRRVLIVLMLLGVFMALVPPFLTHGACTAEFDSVTDAFQQLRPEFATLTKARSYLASRALSYQLLSAERCLIWPAREVIACPGGPVLLVSVPVKDRVCHYYRDRHIQQPARVQTVMKPYQILRLPMLGIEIDWAK